MPRRLVWVGFGVALIVAAILFFQASPTNDSFTRLMSRGNGYLEKEDATNAIAT
jgi:hypothetical protein